MGACQGVSSWGGVGAGVFRWEFQVAPQQPGIAICFVLSGNRAATPSCRTAPWQGWRVNPSPLPKAASIRTYPSSLPSAGRTAVTILRIALGNGYGCIWVCMKNSRGKAAVCDRACGKKRVRLAHPQSETVNRRSSSKRFSVAPEACFSLPCLVFATPRSNPLIRSSYGTRMAYRNPGEFVYQRS